MHRQLSGSGHDCGVITCLPQRGALSMAKSWQQEWTWSDNDGWLKTGGWNSSGRWDTTAVAERDAAHVASRWGGRDDYRGGGHDQWHEYGIKGSGHDDRRGDVQSEMVRRERDQLTIVDDRGRALHRNHSPASGGSAIAGFRKGSRGRSVSFAADYDEAAAHPDDTAVAAETPGSSSGYDNTQERNHAAIRRGILPDDRNPTLQELRLQQQLDRVVTTDPITRDLITTVAPDPQDSTAVAAGPPPEVIIHPKGVQYFQDRRVALRRHWRQHNTALKWLREMCEAEGKHYLCLGIARDEPTMHSIAEISRPGGTSFTFRDTERWGWCWQDMVAQMGDSSMEVVVLGDPPVVGRRLAVCHLQESDVYDHKRHAALKAERKPPPTVTLREWHFVFTRSDGTTCSVRPTYAKPTIQFTNAPFEDTTEEVPRTGLGGTSGPGTFRRFMTRNQTKSLKFDGNLPTGN